MNRDNKNHSVFYEQHLRNIVQVLRTRMVLCSQVTEIDILEGLQKIFSNDYKRLSGTNSYFSFNMLALNAKHDLDFNTGLLYGIFSAGTCDRSTRRIRRIVQVGKKILNKIVQVGKKILEQFRSGDDDCVHCTQNCSTNANKQMRGRSRQNLQICV